MELFSDSNNTASLDRLESEFRVKAMPLTIFVGVQILFGILGNAFVLYVFGFRYNTGTYRCFVFYLGLIDIISCFTTMPGEIVSHLFWFSYKFRNICKIKSFFNIFTVSADVLCLVTIAIDRYKRTCIADTVKMSPLLAVYLLFGITLTAGGLAVPGGIVSGLNHFNRTFEERNISVTICGVEDNHQDSPFDQIYVIVLQSVLGLSLFSMFILYVVIAVALCKAHDATLDDGSHQRLLSGGDQTDTTDGDRRQTVLLLFVTMFFIVTIVTYLILDSFIAKKVESFSLKETVIYLVFFRLYFFNHAINPFIYGWLDIQFRNTFKSIVRC